MSFEKAETEILHLPELRQGTVLPCADFCAIYGRKRKEICSRYRNSRKSICQYKFLSPRIQIYQRSGAFFVKKAGEQRNSKKLPGFFSAVNRRQKCVFCLDKA